MAGSRQHLTCSFMRACLRCLTLVDAVVLLQLFLPAAVIMVLLLYCGWLWCCYYFLLPLWTKKLKKHTRRENETTQVQKKCRRQRKAGKVQKVIDGGGVQVATCVRGHGGANRARSEKNLSSKSTRRFAPRAAYAAR